MSTTESVISVKLRGDTVATITKIRRSPTYHEVPSATEVVEDALEHYCRHIESKEGGSGQAKHGHTTASSQATAVR